MASQVLERLENTLTGGLLPHTTSSLNDPIGKLSIGLTDAEDAGILGIGYLC